MTLGKGGARGGVAAQLLRLKPHLELKVRYSENQVIILILLL